MNSPLQLSLFSFKKDTYIIVEGKQNADRFYIIRSGKVLLEKEVQVVEEEGGNVLGPGDSFGVVSAMSNHSHIETAKALTDCILISVKREQYGPLIMKNAAVAMKIIMSFSRRMRYLDEALTRLTLKNIADGDPSHLFMIAEYYEKQNHFSQAHYSYYQYLKYCPQGAHATTAKAKLEKIAGQSNAVYLEGSTTDEFNRAYPKDTMIFAEGMPGTELYIIQRGSVKITKIVNNNEVMLALLKAGDIFGEMALLENKPRSANAIAFEDTQLLAVNKANFELMVQTKPQIITRLTNLLAERIWFIYKQLANTLLTNPLARLFDAMLIQLEKNRVSVKSTSAYVFDFGIKELVGMVGLPANEGVVVARKLLENSKFRPEGNKLAVTDVSEIEKQAEYYRKMQKIEKGRRDSQSMR